MPKKKAKKKAASTNAKRAVAPKAPAGGKKKAARQVAPAKVGRTSAKAAPPQKKAAKAALSKATPSKAALSQKNNKVEAVPAQYGTATPHLIVSPCRDALDFYVEAFGATVTSTMPGPGGIIMHAEMKIGDSMIMLSDEMPPMPGQAATRKTPRNAGATTGGVMLYVEDVDTFVERAVAAGATAAMPPQDMFWGDRYAQLEDPYAHVWAVATHLRDLSQAELEQAMAQMGAPEA
jgi:PhnB protein